jgi:hypothetical protein
MARERPTGGSVGLVRILVVGEVESRAGGLFGRVRALGAGDQLSELSELSSGTSVAQLGLSALVDRVWLFLGK